MKKLLLMSIVAGIFCVFLPAVHSQGTPCKASGSVVDVGYYPQYLTCKSNLKMNCLPGNSLECGWYILQALWLQQSDGTWQLFNYVLEDNLWASCGDGGPYQVQLFTFEPAGIMGSQSSSGNYYYSCGLFAGTSYTYPINMIDSKGVYFTIP